MAKLFGRSTNRLGKLLASGASRQQIAEHLDGLSPPRRDAEALALGGRQVGRLYDAVSGGRALGISDIVADDVPAGRTVIFEGRNSLPAFTHFQKRFARLESGQVVGYNHQTMSFATGPGFFVVKTPDPQSDVPGELYFDYTQMPEQVPHGWPEFMPNTEGLSLLVYANMKDYMREVARGVLVGAAYKRGKRQSQYFLLAREPND